MGNVFGEFIQTAENAKAMIQKKFGKNLSGFQINRMALVKFFFFSKEEIKKYKAGGVDLDNRIYKWFEKDRQAKVDYMDLALHIDRMLKNEDRFYYDLDNIIIDKEGYEDGIYFSAYAECFMEQWGDELLKSIGAGFISKDSTFGSRVAAFFIQGLKGKRVKESVPCSIQTAYYIPRPNMEKLVETCSDKNFICVEGDTYSGKTTLLIKYAKDRKIKIVCSSGAESYKDVLDSIIIEEDVYLDMKKRKRLGYLLNADSLEIKEKRIERLEDSFWLIIDKFEGKQKDYNKLEQLTKRVGVTIFLEPVVPYPCLQDKFKIYVEPLAGFEIRKLFNLMKSKYNGNIKELSDTEERLLDKVQKAVYDNPGLIILVAEYYWGMQASGKVARDQADVFLEGIASGKDVYSEKFYSVLTNDKSGNKRKQKQHNIFGHIRHLFEQYVPTEEKNVFYVLSLLSAVEIEMKYLEKWFGIDKKVLGNLEWKGWCSIGQEKMLIGIPQLVVHALKKDIFRTAKDVEPFREYIQKMTKTITKREIEPIEVEVLQKVMLCLHNELLLRIQEKPSKVDETVCEFHFACINHFLNYGNAAEAKSLMDETFSYEGIKKCKGSSVYHKMLKRKKQYMMENNIKRIVDDMIRFVKDHQIYESAYGIQAMFELVDLFTCKVLAVNSIMLLESSVDQGVYRSQLLEYKKLHKSISDLIEIVTGCSEPKRFENLLYQRMFEYAAFIGCNPQCLQYVCRDEKRFLNTLQKSQESSKYVSDQESELLVRVLFLNLYAQFYMNEMKQGRHRNFFIRIELRSVIGNSLDQVLSLRNEVGELPINLADLFYAAVILACHILDRKEDALVQEGDYSHVNLNNSEFSKYLKGIIINFNHKMQQKEL